MVFGPLFSRDRYRAEPAGVWRSLEEVKREGGAGAEGLMEEPRSLLLKEVDRRTLDWASFTESL